MENVFNESVAWLTSLFDQEITQAHLTGAGVTLGTVVTLKLVSWLWCRWTKPEPNYTNDPLISEECKKLLGLLDCKEWEATSDYSLRSKDYTKDPHGIRFFLWAYTLSINVSGGVEPELEVSDALSRKESNIIYAAVEKRIKLERNASKHHEERKKKAVLRKALNIC